MVPGRQRTTDCSISTMARPARAGSGVCIQRVALAALAQIPARQTSPSTRVNHGFRQIHHPGLLLPTSKALTIHWLDIPYIHYTASILSTGPSCRSLPYKSHTTSLEWCKTSIHISLQRYSQRVQPSPQSKHTDPPPKSTPTTGHPHFPQFWAPRDPEPGLQPGTPAWACDLKPSSASASASPSRQAWPL